MPVTRQQKIQLIKLFVKANESGEQLFHDLGGPPVGGEPAVPPGIDRDDPGTRALAQDVLDYHQFLKQLMADL